MSKITRVILLAMLLTGCEPEPLKKITFSNGKEVWCRYVDYSKCGMMLSQCDDGARYNCVTDMKVYE